MAGVQINFSPAGNTSGGNLGDAIKTTEYADSTAADAAITARNTLPVTTPTALDGTALKKQHIPVAAIKTIVSL